VGRRLCSAPPSITNQNTTNAAAAQIRPNLIGSTSIYLPQSEPNGTGSQYLVPVNASNVRLGAIGICRPLSVRWHRDFSRHRLAPRLGLVPPAYRLAGGVLLSFET
jgi:hypothetical protein